MADEVNPEVGMIEKFEVKRLVPSSRGIDHSKCQYFVLDPEHDSAAEQALITYAKVCGNEELAKDISAWLTIIRTQRIAQRLNQDLSGQKNGL